MNTRHPLLWGIVLCTMICSLVLACGELEKPSKEELPKEPAFLASTLTPEAQLVRVSMSIKGSRPSLEELNQVRKDPKNLQSIVDKYLKSAAFGFTIREMHAQQFLIDVSPDYYPGAFPAIGPLKGMELHALNTSLGEAAPRLVEHVVMKDKPYSEIVTTHYTLANKAVATVWGIPYDATKGGWQLTKYKDGRPAAGVLSDGFMFTRHASTFANRNRGRAQQMARIFLCVDYANREVDLSHGIDLSNDEAVQKAVRKNKLCNSCHQTLDPLASFFGAHYPLRLPEQEKSYPLRQYAPEYAELYQTSPPMFFGKPGKDLKDLGRFIAKDPRFASCTVRRFYSHFMDIPIQKVPFDRVLHFTKIFQKNKLNAKTLIRAIVLSKDFHSLQAKSDAKEQTAKDIVGFRRANPHQLNRMFGELTGFYWETDILAQYNGTIGRVNLTTDSFFGFKILSGGTDGYDTWFPMRTVNPTTVLLLQGLAKRAAVYVVTSDFKIAKTKRRLLRFVEPDTRSEADIKRQLQMLHQRLYGKFFELDDKVLQSGWKLFQALSQNQKDTKRAWSILLATFFQDIRMLYY